MILAALVLFVLIISAAYFVKKISATRQDADPESYFGLTADTSAGLDAAEEGELAVIIDGEIITARALNIGGFYYISRETAETYVDERLYYGEEDEILLLTNAVSTYKTYTGESTYTLDGEETDLGHVLVAESSGTVYISLEYLKIFSNLEYETFEEPDRIFITTETGEFEYTETAGGIRIRTGAYKTAGILARTEEGEELRILETAEDGDWVRVISESGWVGYIASAAVSEIYTKTVAGNYTDPEYTSLSADADIIIGFAALYKASANSSYSSITENAAGTMNVYCPLWYSLSDEDDCFESISDSRYTALAHADGCLVWAVFTDTDGSTGENYGDDVLRSYEKRQQIIDAVMADMEANDIDGLNMDFEQISSEYSEDYLQFLRELSARCRAAGKYFTADNYAPYEYNDTIFSITEQNDLCDYVIIMAYDDYVGGDEAGPNSSTPFLEEVLELSLDKIDAGKLVVVLPFYTRFWYETDGELTNSAFSIESSWEELSENAVTAEWDDELDLYYVSYEDEGSTVYAWLENEETISSKLSVLSGYSIAGTGFWRLGWGTSEIWKIIDEYY